MLGVEQRNRHPEEYCVDLYGTYLLFYVDGQIRECAVQREVPFQGADFNHMIGEDVIVWVVEWFSESYGQFFNFIDMVRR